MLDREYGSIRLHFAFASIGINWVPEQKIGGQFGVKLSLNGGKLSSFMMETYVMFQMISLFLLRPNYMMWNFIVSWQSPNATAISYTLYGSYKTNIQLFMRDLQALIVFQLWTKNPVILTCYVRRCEDLKNIKITFWFLSSSMYWMIK